MKTKYLLIYSMLFSLAVSQGNYDAAVTGISRAFNPALSANSLFYGMASDLKEPLWPEIGLKPGLDYREVCLEMTANVDIYLKSKVVFSANREEGVGLEEAYVTTLRMPLPVLVRMGKMFNSFGRHNLYHLHHMAFAEPPMILSQIFGAGLNETGIEISYLTPAPWYSDLLIGVLDGENQFLFNSDNAAHLAYLGHWDNLWDLSDEIALRLGGSYLMGRRGSQATGNTLINSNSLTSHVWGIDGHLKWKPMHYGRYRSLTVQGEYLQTRLQTGDKFTVPLQGFFVQILAQFKLRWWLQARLCHMTRSAILNPYFPEPVSLDYDPEKDLPGHRYSFAISYVPTEFSAYRLQYNQLYLANRVEKQFIAQLNVTIGSHPAHKY
jgi:hypothetical protein